MSSTAMLLGSGIWWIKQKNKCDGFLKLFQDCNDGKTDLILPKSIPIINHNHFMGYTKDDYGNLKIASEEAEIIKKIFICEWLVIVVCV